MIVRHCLEPSLSFHIIIVYWKTFNAKNTKKNLYFLHFLIIPLFYMHSNVFFFTFVGVSALYHTVAPSIDFFSISPVVSGLDCSFHTCYELFFKHYFRFSIFLYKFLSLKFRIKRLKKSVSYLKLIKYKFQIKISNTTLILGMSLFYHTFFISNSFQLNEKKVIICNA